ncbi:MAG: hypothetical protein LBB90_11600 [Tannerella sp.]|jgi:hypothetical protein|nr:hypothetical protein [Tannerella sp.]
MCYFLIYNHLRSDRWDQIAIPTNISSYSDEQIIDRIMQQGATLIRPDLLAGIRACQKEHGYIVEDGNGFNTGLITAGPGAPDKFSRCKNIYGK